MHRDDELKSVHHDHIESVGHHGAAYSGATGTVGKCVWSLRKGVLTIAPGPNSGDLPYSWEAADDDSFCDQWLWRDLLGDLVHDVLVVIIEPGVTAWTMTHMFGYFEYGENEEPHSFDNVHVFDLSGLDCSYVTEMAGAFYDCSSMVLVIPPKAGLRPCPVDVNNMYAGCSSLKSVDLSWIDFRRVKDFGRMFAGCTSLSTLDVTDIEPCDEAYMGDIFEGCRLGYRVFSKKGLDVRFAEQMVFAREGSMMASQLEADMQLAMTKMEAIAHCKPTTLIQAISYLYAIHEDVVREYFALCRRPSLNDSRRLWRFIRHLDTLLENFGEALPEDVAQKDEQAANAIMELVRSEPERQDRIIGISFDDAFGYLSSISLERYVLTSWSSDREHHDYLVDKLIASSQESIWTPRWGFV